MTRHKRYDGTTDLNGDWTGKITCKWLLRKKQKRICSLLYNMTVQVCWNLLLENKCTAKPMGRETLSFVLLPLSVLGQIVNWDFNCVLHPTLDRSHPSHTVTSLNNSSQSINAFLQTYGMVDPWRLRHQTFGRWGICAVNQHTNWFFLKQTAPLM